MCGAPTPTPSPLKDVIDANSGRFEFLKQSLTLGLAGIGGVAALFTDPSRIPNESFPKMTLLCAGAGLLLVVAFAVMGLSAYANLLTVTAKVPSDRSEVDKYATGVRDHARIVIIGLFAALIGTVAFSVNRLFASPATPESAVTAAANFVAKEKKLSADLIHFSGMVADTDAYVVTYLVPTAGSEVTVRISKKDGSLAQVTQQKKP